MRKGSTKRWPRRTAAGFTLLELITTVTIVGILLGIGIPAFTSTIRNNKLTSQANGLIGSLNLARSEALKRGIQVSVCARAGDKCSGTSDWSNGWLVFTDDGGTTGDMDTAADTLLQASSSSADGISVSGDASYVAFSATGAVSKRTLTVSLTKCADSKRTVSVSTAGRISVSKDPCS